MSLDFMNFHEYEEFTLFSENISFDIKASIDWVEEALNSKKNIETNERWISIMPSDDSSLFAEEGTEELIIQDVKSYLSKETQSSGEVSQSSDELKTKRRIWTKVTFEKLEEYVKLEIEREGYDSVLNFWLMNFDEEEEEKKVTMRNHNNKNRFQVQKLNEALRLFPKKFPIKERRKLSIEIGLSEEQIYRWYYERNPNIKRNKPKTISK